MAVGYYPDVPGFSDRLFAGGRVTFVAVLLPERTLLRAKRSTNSNRSPCPSCWEAWNC